MSDTLSRSEIIARAIATTSRVAREGGTGEVKIQDPETGKLTTVEIDQTGAREILAGLLDCLASDLWRQIRDGQRLAPSDRQFLTDWTSATVAEHEAAEHERRAESDRKRAHFYLIEGGKP